MSLEITGSRVLAPVGKTGVGLPAGRAKKRHKSNELLSLSDRTGHDRVTGCRSAPATLAVGMQVRIGVCVFEFVEGTNRRRRDFETCQRVRERRQDFRRFR